MASLTIRIYSQSRCKRADYIQAENRTAQNTRNVCPSIVQNTERDRSNTDPILTNTDSSCPPRSEAPGNGTKATTGCCEATSCMDVASRSPTRINTGSPRIRSSLHELPTSLPPLACDPKDFNIDPLYTAGVFCKKQHKTAKRSKGLISARTMAEILRAKNGQMGVT